VQELEYGIHVAAGERLIATAYALHVFLRHRPRSISRRPKVPLSMHSETS
jgi:hypothetical protein